jgi:hypothetical protein
MDLLRVTTNLVFRNAALAHRVGAAFLFVRRLGLLDGVPLANVTQKSKKRLIF